MRTHLTALCIIALISTTISPLMADVILPSGLSPGDKFRIVFATSTSRDATSTDISDYNDFVASHASSNATLLSLGTTWKAIASTPSVDAIDNTGTTGGGGVPIYRTDGTLVANNYADLWDGSILSPIGFDENGNDVGAQSVWTGTTTSGIGFTDGQLGVANPLKPRFGFTLPTNGSWISDVSAFFSTFNATFFGLSEELTEAAPPAPVPEPTSLAIWSLIVGIGLAVGHRRRRKRKAA